MDLKSALAMFNTFLKVQTTMNFKVAYVFLYIAKYAGENGVRIADITRDLNIAYSTVNGHCAALGAGVNLKKGLELIEDIEDAEDWRAKRVRLTQKGKELAATIKAL